MSWCSATAIKRPSVEMPRGCDSADTVQRLEIIEGVPNSPVSTSSLTYVRETHNFYIIRVGTGHARYDRHVTEPDPVWKTPLELCSGLAKCYGLS